MVADSKSANTYAPMSYQDRRGTAESYNASLHPGFTYENHGGNVAGTHWVTPGGVVVTWEGEIVSSPDSN